MSGSRPGASGGRRLPSSSAWDAPGCAPFWEATSVCPPQHLRFAYTPNGKPYLPETPHLTFSLTHTGDLGLLAVTCHRRVGVDVEAPTDGPTGGVSPGGACPMRHIARWAPCRMRNSDRR